MKFHVLTLFQELIEPYFQGSILGKAAQKGLFKIIFHDLRTYATDKHRQVDDKVYGGGAGMVFKVDVLVKAVRAIREQYEIDKVLLTSPRGPVFNHQTATSFAKLNSLLLICGRYEGVDQRAIDLVVDDEISIGDYVMTGGELAAQVIIDSVARQIPGVVGHDQGLNEESFTNGQLEYPQYTRPENFEGHTVPKVLLSGNHQAIQEWKKQASLEVTRLKRPDLIK